MPSTQPRQHWSWPALIGLTIVQLWAAHALVFFAHEYAHSFTAWMLQWKQNPFALNYAHPTLTVLLIQLGISQNVNEAPIFASGHGVQAGIIGAAGAVLGNAIVTYTISRWLYRLAQKRDARGWAMFAYWIGVASVGNLIDYVPIRTFVTGGDFDQDMYAVERGFGWSPWTLLVVFGIPTALVLVYFFFRAEPETLEWIFPHSRSRRSFVAVLTAVFLFAFYGAAGWTDGGPVAHGMSVISVCLVAPVIAALTAGLSTMERGPRR